MELEEYFDFSLPLTRMYVLFVSPCGSRTEALGCDFIESRMGERDC